jgi:hypothetical protein
MGRTGLRNCDLPEIFVSPIRTRSAGPAVCKASARQSDEANVGFQSHCRSRVATALSMAAKSYLSILIFFVHHDGFKGPLVHSSLDPNRLIRLFVRSNPSDLSNEDDNTCPALFALPRLSFLIFLQSTRHENNW